MLLGRQEKSCSRQLGMEMSLSMPVLQIFLSTVPFTAPSVDRFYTKTVGIGTKQIPLFNNSHGCQVLKLLRGAPINELLSRENGKSNLKQNINDHALQRGGDLTHCSGEMQIILTHKISVTSSSSWCCIRSCGEKPQRLHSLDFTMIGINPKGCLIVPCGTSFTDQLMSA